MNYSIIKYILLYMYIYLYDKKLCNIYIDI